MTIEELLHHIREDELIIICNYWTGQRVFRGYPDCVLQDVRRCEVINIGRVVPAGLAIYISEEALNDD